MHAYIDSVNSYKDKLNALTSNPKFIILFHDNIVF